MLSQTPAHRAECIRKSRENMNRPAVPEALCHVSMQHRRNQFLEEGDDKNSADRLRMRGVYFDSYNAIWDTDPEVFEVNNTDSLDEIRRDPPVDHFDDRMPDLNRRVIENSSWSSQLRGLVLDVFQRRNPQRAHLIPHYETSCAAYGVLAEAAMGVQTNTPLQRVKLIRGVTRHKGETKTGLRNSVYNLVPVAQQGDYYDHDPYLMIIPIYANLAAVKTWQPGQAYDCMVICGVRAGEEEADVASAYKDCLGTCFDYCTLEEATSATQLLVTFVRATASCLRNEGSLGILDHVTDVAEKTRLRMLLGNRPQGVPIPSMMDDLNFDNRRIAKIHLPAQLEGHVPDPFLLLVKAAVNFSASQDCRLMPCVHRPPLFEDTSKSEASFSTEEEEETAAEEHQDNEADHDRQTVGLPVTMTRYIESSPSEE